MTDELVKVITVRLPEGLAEELDRRSELLGISKSYIIRESLKATLFGQIFRPPARPTVADPPPAGGKGEAPVISLRASSPDSPGAPASGRKGILAADQQPLPSSSSKPTKQKKDKEEKPEEKKPEEKKPEEKKHHPQHPSGSTLRPEAVADAAEEVILEEGEEQVQPSPEGGTLWPYSKNIRQASNPPVEPTSDSDQNGLVDDNGHTAKKGGVEGKNQSAEEVLRTEVGQMFLSLADKHYGRGPISKKAAVSLSRYWLRTVDEEQLAKVLATIKEGPGGEHGVSLETVVDSLEETFGKNDGRGGDER